MKKTKYSNPYLAKDYFSKDILPTAVYAGRKTLRQSLPYRQHEDIEIMLVRSGSGIVTVNARSFPISRGSLLCFNPTQFYKLDLDKGSRLEITECHINSGLYFYLSACPYYHSDTADVPIPPVYAQLDELRTVHATNLMDELGASCEKTPISENQPAFFLLMKLFGILEKYAAAPD